MLDKNNLNRVKGILSAQLGAEIPKFQNPAVPLPNSRPFYITSKVVNGVAVYLYWLDGKEVSQNQYFKDPRVVLSVVLTTNSSTLNVTSVQESVLNNPTTPSVTNHNGMYLENPYGNPIPDEIKVNTPTSAVIGNPAPQGDMSRARVGSTYTIPTVPPQPVPAESNLDIDYRTSAYNMNKGPLGDMMKTRVGDMTIPGDPGLTPNTAIENSAVYNATVADTRLAALVKRLAIAKIHELYKPDKLQISQDDLNADLKAKALADVESATVSGLGAEAQSEMDANAKAYIKSLNDALAKKLRKQEITGQIAQMGTKAFTAIGDAFGASQAATDSDLTKGITTGYKGVQSAISNLGPIGQAVSGIMGIASATGDILQSLGGGTDQQSTLDKWMDSPLLSWNIGAVNGFFGKKSDSFAIDLDTVENVGSSYGDTVGDLNDALKKANKKYGLFSGKSRKKANAAIAEAKAKQNLMTDISDTAIDQRLAVSSMGEQAGLAYSMMTGGGYDLKYTYAAKHGGLLEWNPVLTLEWEPQIELNWELPEFKEGGSIDIIEELEWVPETKKEKQYPEEYLKFKASLPDNQKNTPESEYDTYLGWKLYGKPKDFEAAKKLGMYTWDNSDNSWHGNTIAWDETTGVGHFLKPKHHSTIGYELDWFNKGVVTEKGGKQREMTTEERKEWEDFKNNYTLIDEGDFYKYIPKNKKGGSVGNSDIPEIEETTLKNVIPEGALHKNKHHMEHAEGLTKKGIPVIDEDGEQLAEIEHSEIIFTLEVTKKLEEYYEIFYSEETSNKEKEQAALEAGKLLVYQILENTEDRTGLIESCKKGGSLTLKKSTDDLIEEVLDWMPTLMIVEEIVEEIKEEEKPEKKSEKELMKEAIKEVLIELLTK